MLLVSDADISELFKSGKYAIGRIVLMIANRKIAVVGSRIFKNWEQLKKTLDEYLQEDDTIVSGGAIGVDSMAQRYAKERGYDIHIFYPKYGRFGRGATFIRNKRIVENSDLVLAFYSKGRKGLGGTRNTIDHSITLNVPYQEFEEE